MKNNRNTHKKHLYPIAVSVFLLFLLFSSSRLSAQNAAIRVLSSNDTFKPMENVVIVCQKPGILQVKDSHGAGNISVQRLQQLCIVPVAGATGTHTALLLNSKGIPIDSAQFNVQTETSIEDGGQTGDMFRLFHQGMLVYDPDGVSEITWNGKTYRYFVEWVLDNNNTMKGMQYFSPDGAGLVDLLRENQQPNGMIWSFVRKGDDDYHYYEYCLFGYSLLQKRQGYLVCKTAC